ncbi:MAG: response regulator [Nitrospira sp.]|nr:response regulator [Nitrospira sp.]
MEKNILIVDDCRTTRTIISLYLKSAGYKTIMAANGFDAVEKLMNSSVDFIITDLNMPQMDGIELTKWVRNNSAFQDIPLIILTTEQDDISRTKGINNGASAYLTKPVTKDKLVKEINTLLDKVKRG